MPRAGPGFFQVCFEGGKALWRSIVHPVRGGFGAMQCVVKISLHQHPLQIAPPHPLVPSFGYTFRKTPTSVLYFAQRAFGCAVNKGWNNGGRAFLGDEHMQSMLAKLGINNASSTSAG